MLQALAIIYFVLNLATLIIAGFEVFNMPSMAREKIPAITFFASLIGLGPICVLLIVGREALAQLFE